MRYKLDPIALATKDGVVTGMSDHEQVHPLYGTPAFDVHVRTKLTGIEQVYANEVLRGKSGVDAIRFSTRSWAAQLGLAAFNPECTDVRLCGSELRIDTLVSDIAGKEDDILLSSLRNNAHTGAAKIARAVLLPHGSKLGELHLPLCTDAHYAFDRSKLSSEELDEVWMGKSGREAILSIRRDMGGVSDVLQAGQYLVGEVQANTGDNCWLLEPDLIRNDVKVPVLHDQSCLYDPRRTTGKRQVEIRNINGKPESLKDLWIRVSVYKTNTNLFHCDHTKGV